MEDLIQNEVSLPDKATSGIGGWLILPAIWLIIIPLKFIKDIMYSIKISMIFGRYPSGIFLNTIITVILTAFIIYVAIKFFKKKKAAPKLYISFLLSFTIFSMIKLSKIILLIIQQKGKPVITERRGFIIRSLGTLSPLNIIIICLILIAYLLKSKRVQNTFVN